MILLTLLCGYLIQVSWAEIEKKTDSPSIYYLHIDSLIHSRFATTRVTSKVVNPIAVPQEVLFKVYLPTDAFITNFIMEIDGKVIVADIKEKEAAKKQFDDAKSRGESAGLVSQNLRETNSFEIAVNLGASSKATFNLTYQEVLTRVQGYYKHTININPGQPVDDLQIRVVLVENAEISKVKVPTVEPKIGEKTNSELIDIPDSKDVTVKADTKNNATYSRYTVEYRPKSSVQRDGQLVVLYDVKRDANSGQIEVVDGYFVHFFAPIKLSRGNKHVVFVLDTSGSMQGEKIKQLKEAMKTILKDLKSGDIFNIVTFSSDVHLWKPESLPVNAKNIQEATDFTDTITADGGTDIYAALKKGTEVLNQKTNTLVSTIFFLTDGQATVGEVRSDKILSGARDWAKSSKTAINCVAFGNDADLDLLQKIASQNRGIAKRIYVDSDTSLQLKGFYDQVSTPLLAEVKVKYLNDTVDPDSVVNNKLDTYYDGSEVMILGRVKDNVKIDSASKSAKLTGTVSGQGAAKSQVFDISYPIRCYDLCPQYDPCPVCGISLLDDVYYPYPHYPRIYHRPCAYRCPPPPTFPPITTTTPRPLHESNTFEGFVERMWAYMSIKKYLNKMKYNEPDSSKQEELKRKALALSLKYHFVTELTSLVVTQDIQPQLNSVESKDKKESEASKSGSSGRRPKPHRNGLNGRGNAHVRPLGPGANGISGHSSRPFDSGSNGKSAASRGSFFGGLAPPSPVDNSNNNNNNRGSLSKADTNSQISEDKVKEKNKPSTTATKTTTTPKPTQTTTTGTKAPATTAKTNKGKCFKTLPATFIKLDRSKLQHKDNVKSRKDCANLCFNDQNSCKAALWLPKSNECLLAYVDVEAVCSVAESTVPDAVDVLLYCISCET